MGSLMHSINLLNDFVLSVAIVTPQNYVLNQEIRTHI